MKNSIVTRSIVIAAIFALLVGFISMTTDMYQTTVRNGEEYTEALMGGEIYRQELVLEHTPVISIGVLPSYTDEAQDMGIQYTLTMGDREVTGFSPVTANVNNEWGHIRIMTGGINYVGEAELVLKAVGLGDGNYATFLITTNTLQPHPECKLYKNGKPIENGSLSISRLMLRFDQLPRVMLMAFLAAFILAAFVQKARKSIREYPLAYMTAILFLLGLLLKYPNFQAYTGFKHVTAQYYFSWQNLGFVRRSLAGTVMELFGFSFTQRSYILYGIVCIALMLGLELCILYDKRHITERRSMEKCFFLFLCLPFAVMAFFEQNYFARLDQLLIIAFLLSCIAVIKERGMWLIPIFSAIAVLTHEVYLVLFVPFIFCLLLYKWYLTREKKYYISLAVSSSVSIFLSLYVGAFSHPSVTYEEAWNYMQTHGNPDMIWDWLLGADFYTSRMSNIANAQSDILRFNGIPSAVLTALILMPLIVMACLWIRAYYKRQKDLLGKLIVLLFPCVAVSLPLVMFTASDYGRWEAMFGIGVFFSFLTLWSMDREGVRESAREVYIPFFRRFGKLMYPGLPLIYMFITMGVGENVLLISANIKTIVQALFSAA